jgi:DNA translocase FtsK/SpoIIIE-like protein
MSEHQRNGKAPGQDALGIFFCAIGAFFAVSTVLFLLGQEPKGGTIRVLTTPVVELVALLGASAALLFSLGLAALGTLLFLRTSAFAAQRPLLALLAGALGCALLLGAFARGGDVGGWLPGLVAGLSGRMLGAVLGLALGFLGWTLLPAARSASGDTSDALRLGLATRHDAAGVSPAEAALLSSDTRTLATRSPRPAAPAPVREETLRPFTPAKPIGSEAPRAARPAPPAPARPEPVRPLPATAPLAPPPAPAPFAKLTDAKLIDANLSVLQPPTPSWEELGAAAPAPEEEPEGETQDEEEMDEELAPAAELTEEEEKLAEEDELEEEEEEDAYLEAELVAAFEAEEVEKETDEPAPAVPSASWEQVGLFDEEEEEEEAEPIAELPPARAAKVETPSFDFDSQASKKPAHEPEPEEAGASDPFAGPPEPADFVLQPTPPPAPAPAPAPRAEPRAEPIVARDEEGERWSQLVFDAGLAILEQKRVAVSMLERRFGIDFDQACRVLDELQQGGLIGPYMGGRTRDILLTREEWLSHAPHAS